MEVRVHIERLVLDGPEGLSRLARERLSGALSAELGRLIAERGLPAGSYAAAQVAGGAAAGSAADPEAYGRALAGAVFAGLERAP